MAAAIGVTVKHILVASDHAGFELKQRLIDDLTSRGYEAEDYGARTAEPTDYPDFAHPLASEMSLGGADRGILLCGSGVGMDIVANRYQNVRAALAWKPEIAELSRQHNDSNVLVLPVRFISEEQAFEIMHTWLATEFEGGRHARRVLKIDQEDG